MSKCDCSILQTCNVCSPTSSATTTALTREQVEETLVHARSFGGTGLDSFFPDILKTDAALRLALAQRAQEIERLKDRNRNLMDVLRAIASMKLAEADRMQQWAKDGLSGFVEPIESTVLKLTDQLSAMTTERDKCKEISDWYGSLVRRASIGTKETPSLRAYIEQAEAKLSARDLSLEGSRAEVAALEQQLTTAQARVKELEEQSKAGEFISKRAFDELQKKVAQNSQLQVALAEREAEIIDLKTCQCEGCDMSLEMEAYCTQCVTKRVDELVSLLAACGATENVDGTLNFDATKFPVANRMAGLQRERDTARHDAARLRKALQALWRLTENHKIQDLDAHAIIEKALKGA